MDYGALVIAKTVYILTEGSKYTGAQVASYVLEAKCSLLVVPKTSMLTASLFLVLRNWKASHQATSPHNRALGHSIVAARFP